MLLTKQSEENILIGLTGDVMIGRLVEEKLAKVEPFYIWGDVLPLMQSMDINLINLEAALTISNAKIYKTFNFKASPERVEVLKLASVSAANLANNHCLDYSEEGLIETLHVLDKAGIPHVGAGENLKEARKPVILEAKGIKIGIIGYTDNEPSWLAKDTSPGIHFTFIDEKGIKLVKEQVNELRSEVDILILTIHWGPNMRERPPKHFQAFARKAIDSGVDIFHGHSAHIFQGIEVYNNKVIFYDTGDFIDDYYVDPVLRNDRSFFFVVESSKKGPVAIHLIPTLISDFQVNLSKGLQKNETIDRMRKMSREFGTELTITEKGLYLPLLT